MAGEIGKPLAVGPLTLPSRVFLAPMSGVTDAPFRRLAKEVGVPEDLAAGWRDAAGLLDPILDGVIAGGKWSPTRRRWVGL